MTKNQTRAAEVLDDKTLKDIKPFSGELATSGMPAPGDVLQQTRTNYITARTIQKPRVLDTIVKNIQVESRYAGASFYYRWEVENKRTGKKSPVQGGSIDLAMALARYWGNCAVPIELEKETPTHYFLRADFVDLETGFTVSRLFRQRKTQNVGGGYGRERAEDMVYQIAQSKAQRNVILKAMPGWLIEECIKIARKAEVGKIDDTNIVAARARALDYFEQMGISQARFEAYMGCPIEEVSASQLADLKATTVAINEGRIHVDEVFPKPEEDAPTKGPDPKPPAKQVVPNRPPRVYGTGEVMGPELLPQQPAPVETEPAPAATTPAPVATEPAQMSPEVEAAFIAEWKNLRGGFGEYVTKNVDRFAIATEKTQEMARKKWTRITALQKVAFPLDIFNAQEPPATENGSLAPQGDTEPAQGPQVGPALHETPEWYVVSELAAQYPEFYAEVAAHEDIDMNNLDRANLLKIEARIKRLVTEQQAGQQPEF